MPGIFPNPVQAQFTVRLPAAAWAGRTTLYNQLGHAVAKRKVAAASADADILFDTSKLLNGLYTRRVEAGHYRNSQPVVVH